jgi:hypothetical protein
MGSMNDKIGMLCTTDATQPDKAAILLGRIQKMLNERQQEIQQRLPRTFVYLTKKENQDKLISGSANCKSFFDGLKAPLGTDLQGNTESFQFIQQIMGNHMKQFNN